MRSLLSVAIIFVLSAGAALADLGMLDPAARPTTRVGPNYVLSLNVSILGMDERELCRAVPVDPKGQIELTVGHRVMPAITVAGLTCPQVQQKVTLALHR